MTTLSPTRPQTDLPTAGLDLTVVAERLCSAAGLYPGMLVLDVSGDDGTTARAVARCGCDVVPFDLGRDPDDWLIPLGDASVDAVVSASGTVDAPDHRAMAAEMVRVCRPRGPIALAVWTPDGLMGGMSRASGIAPLLWGAQDHLRALLAHGVDEIRTRTRTHVLRALSAEGVADQLGGGDEAVRLVRRHTRPGPSGAVTVPLEYLEAVAIRRRAA